ncbi:hypothetical protein [Clostridioides difficile]|uniref:hypothetical protein n=1 Tax=Clostridioides difficile TaxID=1496 RepID=UPI000BB1D3AF|nr:hypothetical protein [Clostridioides difficile]PBE45080.1 hypothetical protein BGU21_20460 [Clostridioides difficile]
MQKKVAAINDLSGIGKCSLSVAIPILLSLIHLSEPPRLSLNSFSVFFFEKKKEPAGHAKLSLDSETDFDTAMCSPFAL